MENETHLCYSSGRADLDRAGRTFEKWHELGYATAAFLDDRRKPDHCDYPVSGIYRGWARAVNTLCDLLLSNVENVDWIVTGGADILPDPELFGDEIAELCTEHFDGTYGVMQPSGDKFGALVNKEACVSPWLGRDWITSAYSGRGPLLADYFHFYADTDLMHVATKAKRLWWCDSFVQYHDHYLRRGESVPAHLERAAAANPKDRALFESRRRAGFPE